MLSQYKPKISFLCETKLNSVHMSVMRVKLGFDNCLCVEFVGRSGGLCLLWKHQCDLIITSYSCFHIDSIINTNSPYQSSWKLTCVYEEPNTHLRSQVLILGPIFGTFLASHQPCKPSMGLHWALE